MTEAAIIAIAMVGLGVGCAWAFCWMVVALTRIFFGGRNDA